MNYSVYYAARLYWAHRKGKLAQCARQLELTEADLQMAIKCWQSWGYDIEPLKELRHDKQK